MKKLVLILHLSFTLILVASPPPISSSETEADQKMTQNMNPTQPSMGSMTMIMGHYTQPNICNVACLCRF